MKPTFLKTHSDETDFKNINLSHVITFRENSNKYNTDVKIKGSKWIVLKISYTKFLQLIELLD